MGHLGRSWKLLKKKTGGIEYQRMNEIHLYYSIVEIDSNTVKSPGELKRLVVTQTLVKDYEWTLLWKNRKEWNSYNSNALNLGMMHIFVRRRPVLDTLKWNRYYILNPDRDPIAQSAGAVEYNDCFSTER